MYVGVGVCVCVRSRTLNFSSSCGPAKATVPKACSVHTTSSRASRQRQRAAYAYASSAHSGAITTCTRKGARMRMCVRVCACTRVRVRIRSCVRACVRRCAVRAHVCTRWQRTSSHVVTTHAAAAPPSSSGAPSLPQPVAKRASARAYAARNAGTPSCRPSMRDLTTVALRRYQLAARASEAGSGGRLRSSRARACARARVYSACVASVRRKHACTCSRSSEHASALRV